MPPRIPVRFPWSTREPLAPLNPSLHGRVFSSTPRALALGPESPNYIEVPKPRQPTFPPTPRIKGVLPTPRNVFKTRSPLAKESDDFIKLSTQEPVKKKIPGQYSKDVEYRLYKQRMAESRRLAFRGGVKELHERQTQIRARETTSLRRMQADKRMRAMAPPRDVDVLTQTSVSKSIRDFLQDQLPSTSRSNISEARRESFRRKMAKHAAVRETRLHDLYINAREFIIDEQQLDEAIEKEFGTEEHPMGWNDKGVMMPDAVGKSPWNGPLPEGVGELLSKLKGGEGVGLAKERVKRVAEELTGGKM